MHCRFLGSGTLGLLGLLGLLVSACPGSGRGEPDRGADQYIPIPLDTKPGTGEATTPKDGPTTTVDGLPAAHCQPYCADAGGQPAWYDGCTKQVLKLPGTNYPYYDSCMQCAAVCKSAGTPAEGWYSSCTTQLIISMKCT
jgi:hypothetical protein